MKKSVFLTCVFFFCLLLNGFGIRNLMVEVDEGANGKTIKLELRQQLEVMLNSNPTSGYSWSVAKIDNDILQQLDFRFVRSGTLDPRVPQEFPDVVHHPVIKPLPFQKLPGAIAPDFKTGNKSIVAGDQIGLPQQFRPKMVGVGGKQELTLKALRKGKTELVLVYARPWEKNQAPAKTFHITVVVD